MASLILHRLCINTKLMIENTVRNIKKVNKLFLYLLYVIYLWLRYVVTEINGFRAYCLKNTEIK